MLSWYVCTVLENRGKKCTSYNNKTYFEFKLAIYNLIRSQWKSSLRTFYGCHHHLFYPQVSGSHH